MVKVIINSGHHKNDEGCIVEYFHENLITMAIRDELKKLMPDALYVPDELNLKNSIKWANSQGIDRNSICVDIHINYSVNSNLRGIEAYYFADPTSAECFSRNVAQSVGLTNRGPIKDNQTAVGSLGWIRQIDARSVVLECGYLSNPYDRPIIVSANGQRKIAQGIYNACVELGYPKQVVMDWTENIKRLQKAGMSLTDIVNWIKRFFGYPQSV